MASSRDADPPTHRTLRRSTAAWHAALGRARCARSLHVVTVHRTVVTAAEELPVTIDDRVAPDRQAGTSARSGVFDDRLRPAGCRQRRAIPGGRAVPAHRARRFHRPRARPRAFRRRSRARTTIAWVERDNENNRRRYQHDETKVPALLREMLREMNSRQFVLFLETLTGIESLLPDPYFIGGGVHISGHGDFLKIHADFNWHHKLQAYRRVNALLYLSDDWQPEWKGAIEFWDREMTRPGRQRAADLQPPGRVLDRRALEPRPARAERVPARRLPQGAQPLLLHHDRDDEDMDDPHFTLYKPSGIGVRHSSSARTTAPARPSEAAVSARAHPGRRAVDHRARGRGRRPRRPQLVVRARQRREPRLRARVRRGDRAGARHRAAVVHVGSAPQPAGARRRPGRRGDRARDDVDRQRRADQLRRRHADLRRRRARHVVHGRRRRRGARSPSAPRRSSPSTSTAASPTSSPSRSCATHHGVALIEDSAEAAGGWHAGRAAGVVRAHVDVQLPRVEDADHRRRRHGAERRRRRCTSGCCSSATTVASRATCRSAASRWPGSTR